MGEKYEVKCLRELLKGVNIPKFDVIRKKILDLYSEPIPLQKGIKKKGLVKYVIRVRRIHEYLQSSLFNNINRLPPADKLNEFYIELLKIAGIDDYDEVVSLLRSRRYVINKITKDYVEKIRLSFDAAEAKKITREYVGRVISVLRRCSKYLDALSSAIGELKKMPCIDFSLPRIVVAGMPQVGKSTFVRIVSSAKPEVSPFPFTTKEVIVGHRVVGYTYIQIIDTPGILDRPFSELNEIEKRALAAIKHLTSSLIFIIDPYEGSYYSLDRQLNLLSSVLSTIVKEDNVVVAVNKVDKVTCGRLSEVVGEIRKIFKGDVLLMSALKGYGVDEVFNKALSKAVKETH